MAYFSDILKAATNITVQMLKSQPPQMRVPGMYLLLYVSFTFEHVQTATNGKQHVFHFKITVVYFQS